MKTILVATDFSLCASNAMAYAMKLAKVLRFEVCAIHAIGPMEGVKQQYLQRHLHKRLSEQQKTSPCRMGKRLQWKGKV